MKKNYYFKVTTVLVLFLALLLSATQYSVASKKIKSKRVTLVTNKATIGVGDIITMNAVMTPANSTDNLKWTSSNNSIATVNKYGVITGIAEGSAVITVKTSSKKKATCTVTVKKYLTQSEINSLVSGNVLPETEIRNIVKKYGLSETDVKKIIENNTVSEKTIKEWIKEAIDFNNEETTWKDGDTIQNWGDLPSNDTMTITSIEIKKYHVPNHENNRTPYKYTLILDGTLSNPEFYYTYIEMTYYSSTGDGIDGRYYPIYWHNPERNSERNIDCSCSLDGNKFHVEIDQYNIDMGYDAFIIDEAYSGNKGEE